MSFRFRPRLEALEPRDAPAVLTWRTPGPGDFNDPVNWGGAVPGPADIAVISQPRAVVSAAAGRVFAGTVVLSAGRLVGGLALPGAFEWTGGALSGAAGITVAGPAAVVSQVPKALDGGTLTLLGGGRFVDGIVALNFGGTLLTAGPSFTLAGGTIGGDGTGRVRNAGVLAVAGPTALPGLLNDGTLVIPVGTGNRLLRVGGDYVQGPDGELRAERGSGPSAAPLASVFVIGTARLGGLFTLSYPGAVVDDAELLPVIRAAQVTGKFANPDGVVNDGDKTILLRTTDLSVSVAVISNRVIAETFGQLSPQDLQFLTLTVNEVATTLDFNDSGLRGQPLPQGAVQDAEDLADGQGPGRAERPLAATVLRVLVQDGTLALFTRFGVGGGTEGGDLAGRARTTTSTGTTGAGGRSVLEDVALPPPPPIDLPVEDPAKALAEEAAYLLTGLRPRSDLMPQRGRSAAPVATLLSGSVGGESRRPDEPAPAADAVLPGLLIDPTRPPKGPQPPLPDFLPGMSAGLVGLGGVLLGRGRPNRPRVRSEPAGP